MSHAPGPEAPSPEAISPRQIPLTDGQAPIRATAVKSHGCRNTLAGCGCVSTLLFVAGTFWIINNWRFLAADTGNLVIKAAIREFQIPPDQRQQINRRLDQLVRRYKEGEISEQQLGRVLENVIEGPMIPAGSALLAERQYLDASGLDEEEKESARRSIRRFTHGAIDESIPSKTVDNVLDTISDSNSQDGQRVFRQSLSDDELRVFISAATQAADAAEVPLDIPAVNFADEFDKAVDDALSAETISP